MSNQNMTPDAPMTEQQVNELVKVRMDKLAALQAAGQDPYVITKYNVTAYNAQIREKFEAVEAAYIAANGPLEEGQGFEPETPIEVSVAGRMMNRRIMGKASFIDLHDATGRMQVYVSRNDVGEEIYAGFKKWDIGDIIGLTGWAGTARIIRAQTLSVKEQQYVERTTSIGAGKWHIMMKHILPNVFPLVFSEAILIVSSSILTETSLAFLGLGDPTNPSWGMMLNDAYSTGAMTVGAWWYFITPGLCVILVALGFTLMGYAFDEILNPKLKER